LDAETSANGEAAIKKKTQKAVAMRTISKYYIIKGAAEQKLKYKRL
jgi:hypothetical protein